MTIRRSRKEIDTIEKLAEPCIEAMDDLRSDMSARFDVLGATQVLSKDEYL